MTSAPTLSRAPAQPVGRLREVRAGVVVRSPPGARVQQRQPPHERAPAACRPMPRRSPRARPRRSDSRPAGPAAGTWPMSSGRSLCSWCQAPRRARADGRTRPECNKRERFPPLQCHPASTRASVRRPSQPGGYPTLGANRATPASLCPAVIAGWQVRVLRWRLPADCLRPRRAVRAALDRPLLRPFPSSSRVLLVIPSLAVRSGRRGRFHSLRGASIRRRGSWRVPVLWVEAMEAGAVTRVSVSRHAVMRTCLGSGDRTRRSRAGCRPRWPRPRRAAPTTTAAIQVSSYKTTAVRVVHQTDGQGYGPTGAKGARSTSRPATRSTTPRATKPRTSTGLRDTYPVYHVSELNIAELRPRTPPTSSDRAIEAQNTEFAEQLKVRGEAPREPDEAERAALVVPQGNR